MLAAILCGSLSHDTVWDRSDIDLVLVTVDDKRVEAGGLALYADGVNVHAILMPRTRVPQHRRRVDSQLVHALAAGEGPPAVHARPDDRRPVRAAARDRRSRCAAPAAACRHRRAARPRQGAQVVRHPRRPRLHRAVDALRGGIAGAGRGDRPRPARRPRGAAAGDDAQSRLLPRSSTPICSTRRRRRRRCRPRSTPRTGTSPSARPGCSSRSSTICARSARRGRPPRSKGTSRATSA